MEASVGPLHEQLTLNTDLLRNCLAGLSEEDATRRPTNDTNNIAFLATHLADARYFLSGYVGCPAENPLSMFEGVNSIDELKGPLPPLSEIERIWGEVSAHLAAALEGLDAARIAEPSEIPFPVRDGSVLGGIAFLIHHDTYHVGQIALIRRQLGYPAMTYDRTAG